MAILCVGLGLPGAHACVIGPVHGSTCGDSWWMSVPEVVDHAWSVKRFERGLSTPDARLHQGGEPTRGGQHGPDEQAAIGALHYGTGLEGQGGGRPSQSPGGFERWRWSPAPAASRDVRTWSGFWPVRVRHGLTEIEEALLDPRGGEGRQDPTRRLAVVSKSTPAHPGQLANAADATTDGDGRDLVSAARGS